MTIESSSGSGWYDDREGDAVGEQDEIDYDEAVGPPEPGSADGESGRLVAPDEGVRADTEADLVAGDPQDWQDLSAEESAMHVVADDFVLDPGEDEV